MAGRLQPLDKKYGRTYSTGMPRPSLKSSIIEAGLRVMFRTGYRGAGVRNVVAEAQVPQGSFTNHFRSKEAFGCEVLDLYFEHTRGLVAEALEDQSLTPRARLQRYLDIITARLAHDGFRRGCLIGDFSLEVVQDSDVLRERLLAIWGEWLRPFADCIGAAQAAGEINDRFAPADLAEFLLASWEGAILRMKVERSAAPLERFKAIAFATVFNKEPTDAA